MSKSPCLSEENAIASGGIEGTVVVVGVILVVGPTVVVVAMLVVVAGDDAGVAGAATSAGPSSPLQPAPRSARAAANARARPVAIPRSYGTGLLGCNATHHYQTHPVHAVRWLRDPSDSLASFPHLGVEGSQLLRHLSQSNRNLLRFRWSTQAGRWPTARWVRSAL